MNHIAQKISVLLLLLMPGVASSQTANTIDLFELLTANESRPLPERYLGIGAGHLRAVSMNSAAKSLLSGDEMDITLPKQTITVVIDKRMLHSNGDVSLIGHLKQEKTLYRTMVTMGSNSAFAKINTAKGLFVLESAESKIWLVDYNTVGFQEAPGNPADGPRPPESRALNAVPQKQLDSESNAVLASDPASTDMANIDLMVLYTDGMAALYTPSELETRLNSLLATSNTTLSDSNVYINLSLVHSAQVNYGDLNDNGGALNALTDETDSAFVGVSDLRNLYGADLITLVRPFQYPEQVGCGIAWLLGNAGTFANYEIELVYSVVSDGSDSNSGFYCPEHTLVHELGHNMGSTHDRANTSNVGTFSYSYGYGASGDFGTVMSYLNPEVGVFSNPDLTCNGSPCGIAAGATGEADNALSLNNVRFEVEAFRASAGTFTDVPANHWASTAIETIAAAGITDGCNNSGTQFCPEQVITRDTLAIWLLRAINGSGHTPATTATSLTDVQSTGFAANWIWEFYEDGYSDGCDTNQYCANQAVTRDSVAITLLRAKYGSTFVPAQAWVGTFNDVTQGSFADRSIERLASDGITTGCDNGNYCPRDAVTRAELAGLIVNTFGL